MDLYDIAVARKLAGGSGGGGGSSDFSSVVVTLNVEGEWGGASMIAEIPYPDPNDGNVYQTPWRVPANAPVVQLLTYMGEAIIWDLQFYSSDMAELGGQLVATGGVTIEEGYIFVTGDGTITLSSK